MFLVSLFFSSPVRYSFIGRLPFRIAFSSFSPLHLFFLNVIFSFSPSFNPPVKFRSVFHELPSLKEEFTLNAKNINRKTSHPFKFFPKKIKTEVEIIEEYGPSYQSQRYHHNRKLSLFFLNYRIENGKKPTKNLEQKLIASYRLFGILFQKWKTLRIIKNQKEIVNTFHY